MRKLWAVVVVFVVVVFAVTSCGPSAKEFQANDPNGYEACETYESSIGSGGNYRRNLTGMAADYGSKSESLEIRQAVKNPNVGAPVIWNSSVFKKACKKAGYKF